MISSHVFFDNQEMAELAARKLNNMESLEVDSSLHAKTCGCHHPWCPSSITVCCTKMEGEDCYYLMHIPHFHDSPIYQADPSHLPSFLQTVLYSHSGLGYLDGCLSRLQSSPTLLLPLFQSKRDEFAEQCREALRSSAMKEFGQSVADDIAKKTNELDGR